MSRHSRSETQPSASRVTAISPEDPKTAEIHFRSRLAFETDPSDVYLDLVNNVNEIMVIDARTQEAYAQCHVPGAINLPWRKIDASSTAAMSRDKALVTYCDGRLC